MYFEKEPAPEKLFLLFSSSCQPFVIIQAVDENLLGVA